MLKVLAASMLKHHLCMPHHGLPHAWRLRCQCTATQMPCGAWADAMDVMQALPLAPYQEGGNASTGVADAPQWPA